MKKFLLALVCLLFIFLQTIQATTITAVQSGNWYDAATWGGTVPADGDTVVIPAGITVNTLGVANEYIAENIPSITVNGTLQLGDPGSGLDFFFSHPLNLIVGNGGTLEDMTDVYSATNRHDFALINNSKITVESGGNFMTKAPTYIYSAADANSPYDLSTEKAFGGRLNLTLHGPFTITIDSDGNVTLPILLFNFSGHYADAKIILNWETASEQNNAYFSVERSEDGNDFREIAKVNSIANSSTVNQYSYTDFGINKLGVDKLFYRLKQVDIDGHFKYYNVIAVSFHSLSAALKLWPNPGNGQFVLTFSKALPAPAILNVYDAGGRLLSHQKLEQSQTNINLSGKMKGIYFLQINYPDNSRQVLRAVVE